MCRSYVCFSNWNFVALFGQQATVGLLKQMFHCRRWFSQRTPTLLVLNGVAGKEYDKFSKGMKSYCGTTRPTLTFPGLEHLYVLKLWNQCVVHLYWCPSFCTASLPSCPWQNNHSRGRGKEEETEREKKGKKGKLWWSLLVLQIRHTFNMVYLMKVIVVTYYWESWRGNQNPKHN